MSSDGAEFKASHLKGRFCDGGGDTVTVGVNVV